MAKKKDVPSGPARIHNRRARFDYEILDTVEAGLVLVGSEVKSVYKGRANLTDAYAKVANGEMWLVNMDIEPYEHSAHFAPDRRRDRKLLLHRREIDTLARRTQEKGLTLIPLALYFKNGKAKVEIGLGRGKRQYDKRESIAKKETQRETERIRGMKRG